MPSCLLVHAQSVLMPKTSKYKKMYLLKILHLLMLYLKNTFAITETRFKNSTTRSIIRVKEGPYCPAELL